MSPGRILIIVIVLLGHYYPGSILHATDVQTSPILYYHESAEEPELAQLINEFDYDAYLSDGITEFEKMTLLKDWVYSHIPYALNYNDSELRNAIHILRRARQGSPFLCSNIASVYLLCSVSRGWTARYILLRRPTNEEHAGNDIWSNQYRKWVYIDPTWNIHIEKSGIPLSIYEIRNEWLKNKGSRIMYVFGAGKSAKRYRPRDLPIIRQDSDIWRYIPLDRTWLGYTHEIALLGRNDFFSCCGKQGSPAWEPMYLIRDRTNRKDKITAFFNKRKRSRPKLLFYDLNRVDIAISQQRGTRKGFYPGTAEVRLDAFGKYNYTPNFMEFLVKINNADWKIMDDRFPIKLAPGVNVVRARIMNRFGVLGPVSVRSIIIKKQLHK